MAMNRKTILTVAFCLLALTISPAVSMAAKGDCGQPRSSGSKPLSSDCLEILRQAVGLGDGSCGSDPKCTCDVNNDTKVFSSDALICLNVAVSVPGAKLNCPNCTVSGVPCTSAELFTLANSDLDSGWTGVGHNAGVVEGTSLTIRTLRRCSGNNAVCVEDENCPSGQLCKSTCDCLPGGDGECEVTGPTGVKRCLTTLSTCTTDADCPTGVECGRLFGPPLPLSSGGSPACVLTVFEKDISGTTSSTSGDSKISAELRSKVFLGETISQPCPQCGTKAQNPKVGDTFTCIGGQTPGASCRVDATTKDFGGVSFNCAPSLSANISGVGLAVRFNNVTTGSVSKTAKLPCGNFLFSDNPTTGTGLCNDTFASCSSNSDCKRCANDPLFNPCSTNADCPGSTCASAPDQPVSCGNWCHCGFCDNDPDLPCFDNEDCPSGKTCAMGTGAEAPNLPQLQPNECSGNDTFICGVDQTEKCHDTTQGTCSLAKFRACSNNTVCANTGSGTCVIEKKPCFQQKITRQGLATPLGKYCSKDPNKTTQCTKNADCAGGTDVCVDDSARPITAALFCVPATDSPVINSAAGLTGPSAIQLATFVKLCRCGDSKIGCDEKCDDGNAVGGDGCDENCQVE